MNFKKFTISTFNEAQQKSEIVDIIINIDHIVSIKPIKITTNDQLVIEGYWVRLSNGKKYKAIQIDQGFKTFFEQELAGPQYYSDEACESFQ